MSNYSYTYQKQPLYRFMIMNVRDQLKSQNPEKPTKNDFDIFKVTSTIGMALGIPKEVVMSDYLIYNKE